MNKEMILNLLKMTEEELVEEVSKYNLNVKELETLNKGKAFGDKISELDVNSKRRVLLSLVFYGLINKNGGK